MTPLIKELVKNALRPEQTMWFDIGNAPAPESGFAHEVDGEYMTHLPFENMAICGIDANKCKFIMYVISGEGSVAVAGAAIVANRRQEIFDSFAYVDTPDGVRLVPHPDDIKPIRIEDCRGAMATIAYTLESLDAGGVGYQPTAKANSPTNQRRIASGRPSLIYDWRTVVIEPKKARAESIGGTHASPRQHERRGHWRVTPSGRKVWVRNCTVGDAILGSVFHDYKVAS